MIRRYRTIVTGYYQAGTYRRAIFQRIPEYWIFPTTVEQTVEAGEPSGVEVGGAQGTTLPEFSISGGVSGVEVGGYPGTVTGPVAARRDDTYGSGAQYDEFEQRGREDDEILAIVEAFLKVAA